MTTAHAVMTIQQATCKQLALTVTSRSPPLKEDLQQHLPTADARSYGSVPPNDTLEGGRPQMEVHKTCATCKVNKPKTEYWKNRASSDGVHSYCKPCAKRYDKEKYPSGKPKRRSRYYEQTYGLTLPELDEMKESQDGKCAICLVEPERSVVDHCHDTGKVRGILCDTCNRAIGLLKDDPEILISAARYLRGGE